MHWAELRRKKWPSDHALRHFDEFYRDVYGKKWGSIRLALLTKSKYCAVVNNFSNIKETEKLLEDAGAVEVAGQYEYHVERQRLMRQKAAETRRLSESTTGQKFLTEEHVQLVSDGSGISREVSETPVNNLDLTNQETHALHGLSGEELNQFVAPNQLQTLSGKVVSIDSNQQQPNDNVNNGMSLVAPSSLIKFESPTVKQLLTSAEFIPATQLKGLEDYVDEDDYYRHYKRDAAVPVQIERDDYTLFPPLMKVYSFDKCDVTRFPEPKADDIGLLNYYLMDGASLLPVLALNVRPHDKILDMCAAPGGKALAILQSLYPMNIVCNDNSKSRVLRLHKVFNSYLPDVKNLKDQIRVTHRDGREFKNNEGLFDKVLVDVPCTTDRHAVTSEEHNLFSPKCLKERVELPKIQTDLLISALHAVRPGGSVVYSTCSLSPIQNDGVVHMALQHICENTSMEVVVKDLAYVFRPLNFLCYLKGPLRYGHLVTPSVIANFGPMYVAKITRIK